MKQADHGQDSRGTGGLRQGLVQVNFFLIFRAPLPPSPSSPSVTRRSAARPLGSPWETKSRLGPSRRLTTIAGAHPGRHGRKNRYLHHPCPHGIGLPQYPDLSGAINNVPAERADGLITHEEYGALPPGDIGHQVVLYPAPVHMPEPAMIMIVPLIWFIAFDSSTVFTIQAGEVKRDRCCRIRRDISCQTAQRGAGRPR